MARVQISEGTAIGYAEASGGERTPIVFLHGVGSDKSVWHPQLEKFGAERRTIAFDYPGYGESDPAPEATSRDDYAAAIVSAMPALGGVVAIAMHDAAPDACASLILADTFASHPDGPGIYERSIAASENMQVFAESRVDVLLGQPADAAVRSEVIETMARIDPAAFRIGAEAVWLADQAERADAIRVPTLVVCGDQDRITPPALSTSLTRMIPGAHYAPIEGAGHLSNLERPEAFNTIVGAFIRGVDSHS